MSAITIVVAIVVLLIVSGIYYLVRGRRGRQRLQPISEESRRAYANEWHDVEIRFIGEPHTALREADRLAVAILSERGAEMHQDRVLPKALREARRLARRDQGLHKAMQRYQSIVDDACGRDVREAAEQGRFELA